MTKENKNYDEDALEFLRKNTTLDPISLIKLNSLKKQIAKSRIWYYKLEGEWIDYDSDTVDECEYVLRLHAWKYKCAPLWKLSGKEIGLQEFSDIVLEQHLKNYKKQKKR